MDPFVVDNKADSKSATLAHVLYLTNITIVPVLSFILLIVLYSKKKQSRNPILLQHYRQSILANVVAGLLLIVVSGLIIFFGSFESVFTWMWLILYFTCIHSLLILFGVFALIKAQAGQAYVYPLFGKFWV